MLAVALKGLFVLGFATATIAEPATDTINQLAIEGQGAQPLQFLLETEFVQPDEIILMGL